MADQMELWMVVHLVTVMADLTARLMADPKVIQKDGQRELEKADLKVLQKAGRMVIRMADLIELEKADPMVKQKEA